MKESLIKKIDCLLQICHPGTGGSGKHKYDQDRIKKIDNQRHEVIHGVRITPLNDIQDDLRYMEETCAWIMSLLNWTYGFKINPYFMPLLLNRSDDPPR